ncbi:MAG TPA: tetratricopeptide repeat protein, partial [Nitrospirota bacterium]
MKSFGAVRSMSTHLIFFVSAFVFSTLTVAPGAIAAGTSEPIKPTLPAFEVFSTIHLPSPSERYSDALSLFRAKDFKKAGASALVTAGLYPGTRWEGRAALLAARAYAELGDFDMAAPLFALSREKLPQLGDYSTYILAGYYFEHGRYEDAAKSYLAVYDYYPDSPKAAESLLCAADSYILLDRPDEAIKVVKPLSLRKLDGAVAARLPLVLMTAHLRLGDNKIAAAYYRQIWMDYPGTPQEDAAENLAKKLEPQHWSVQDWMRRADRLYEKGLPEPAAECYQNALKEMPKGATGRASAMFRLGVCYYKLKDTDKSV